MTRDEVIKTCKIGDKVRLKKSYDKKPVSGEAIRFTDNHIVLDRDSDGSNIDAVAFVSIEWIKLEK